jgi:hypothetical protein
MLRHRLFRSDRTGQVHFDMERAGAPSRWNTLRALRVLQRYARDTGGEAKAAAFTFS